MNKNMVTFIDDLPLISDVESSGGMYPMIPQNESNKVKRMIRNYDHEMPIESGMNTKSQQQFHDEEMKKKMFEDEQQQIMMQQQQMQEQQKENFHIRMKMYEEEQDDNNSHNRKKKKKNRNMDMDCDLNCISVAEHTTNCVVCSKLYNDDRSIYLGSIVVLLIVSMILLKKVVEK